MAASTGRILLISRGDYNPLTEYYILDIVRDGGKTWVCKQTCTGQTPAENTYWFLLAQDGADGIVGSIWYTGTGITGTSETPTIFSGSGVALANATDMYLNSSTGNVYQCTTGGNASTAEWVFVIALGGTASWASIADKPFNTIGSNGLIVNTDVLDVDLLKIERKASTLTSKATVVLADEMVIVDSADSSITKRSPFSALKTLFDTLYNNYVLPTATDAIKGGIKIGDGLTMTGEVLSANGISGEVLDSAASIKNNTTAGQIAGGLGAKDLFDELNSNLDVISPMKAKTDRIKYSFAVDVGITGDMNNIVATGLYCGLNLANAPNTGYVTFICINIANDPLYCRQIAFTNNAVYTREQAGGIWAAWATI